MRALQSLIETLSLPADRCPVFLRKVPNRERIVIALKDIASLVGDSKFKDSVAQQTLSLLVSRERARLHPEIKVGQYMLNTCLYGPPGVGKTLKAQKLAVLWSLLGYLDQPSDSRKETIGKTINPEGKPAPDFTDTLFIFYWIFIVLFVLYLVSMRCWGMYERYGAAKVLGGALVLLIVSFLLYYTVVNFAYPAPRVVVVVDKKGAAAEAAPSMPADEDLVVMATQPDFIGQYVGQTEEKVRRFLAANKGKVVFVDEAYTLMAHENDPYGIKILTILNEHMSRNPRDNIFIFAGYREQLRRGIFTFQKGLERRFMWHFETDGYTADELHEIFVLHARRNGFQLADPLSTLRLFRKYAAEFRAFGGDCERVFAYALQHHDSRMVAMVDATAEMSLLSTDDVKLAIADLADNYKQGADVAPPKRRKDVDLMQALQEAMDTESE